MVTWKSEQPGCGTMPRLARNCAYWNNGVCNQCGAQWQGCEVSPEFACPHFLPHPDRRECTCHPDDNPPRPCPRKFAYSECVSAALESERDRALAALRDLYKLGPRQWIPGASVTWPEWDAAYAAADAVLKTAPQPERMELSERSNTESSPNTVAGAPGEAGRG